MGFPWDKGLAGSVFKSGEPAIVADAKKDGRHYPNIDQLTGFRTRDMIVMPLKQWGHPPIGVLEVMNKRDGCLDEGDVALLTVVSALTTAAVEQARLFEQAKLAEVGHRLADIGHDVNNLLTPVGYGLSRIKADLDRLSESPAGCDVREMLAALQVSKKTLNTVELTVRRVQDRMKQVMDCVQDVKTPPRLTPCCLGTILSEVTRVLGNVAAVTGVMLRVEGVDTLPSILGDERRLFSLFYNLVDNALAEVPPGGAVTVRGKLDSGDKALLLSVIDTGRGMAKDVLESLFSDHTISRKIGGTGLGSKIVKDAVDAHGGRISVESTQGVGTTFLIQLPINPPGPPTQ
jgi:signal transduction histidine kinase